MPSAAAKSMLPVLASSIPARAALRVVFHSHIVTDCYCCCFFSITHNDARWWQCGVSFALITYALTKTFWPPSFSTAMAGAATSVLS
jgi:hypothetical protein